MSQVHAIAYAYPNGRIGRGSAVPEGAVEFARGPADKLDTLIQFTATRDFDRRCFVVPTARQEMQGSALEQYVEWIAHGVLKAGITFNLDLLYPPAGIRQSGGMS